MAGDKRSSVTRVEHVVMDSCRCWFVVAGAFVAHVLTHGIVYSFGILFVALEDRYGGHKAEVALIPAITTGALYLIGNSKRSYSGFTVT